MSRTRIAAAVAVITLVAAVPGYGSPRSEIDESDSVVSAIWFEPNHGQAPASTRFIARTGQVQYHFSEAGPVILAWDPSTEEFRPITLEFAGANSPAAVNSSDKRDGASNYYGLGSRGGILGVPHYGRVRYESLLPGIAASFYGAGADLEYDLELEPGVDVRAVRLRFAGADATQLVGDHVVVRTGGVELTQKAPVVYQVDSHGMRSQVAAGYSLRDGWLSFEVDAQAIDETKRLVIDPVIEFSQYLGSSDKHDTPAHPGLEVDGDGNAFVLGYTKSTNYIPITGGSTLAGALDIVLTKVRPDGSIAYSTYIGGPADDAGHALTTDSLGNAYLTGFTKSSTGFPHDYDLRSTAACTRPGGCNPADLYMTKLDPSGVIVLSTLMGGADREEGQGIVIGPGGDIFLTGITTSVDLPTGSPSGSPYQDVSLAGFTGAGFVIRLSAGGDQLVYSTYLSGSGVTVGTGIAVDPAGNAFVAGQTFAADFVAGVTAPSPLQASYGGEGDAFVTGLNATGSALIFSTFWGGAGHDSARDVVLDSSGNVVVVGETKSALLPQRDAVKTLTPAEILPNDRIPQDGWVTVFLPDGTDYLTSSFIGGAKSEWIYAVDADASGNLYLGGQTSSTNFPDPSTNFPVVDQIPGSSATTQENAEAFAVKLGPLGKSVVYATLIGGSLGEIGLGIASNDAGSTWLSGTTASPDFPGAVTACQGACQGLSDIFVVKIADGGAPDIFVAPDPVDFGSVALPGSSDLLLTISNLGPLDLEITDIQLNDLTNAFSISGATAATIPPDGSIDISLTFAPTSFTPFSGIVTIASDDPDESLLSIVLFGTGAGSEDPPLDQIATILDFIDSSVVDGSLQGSGPNSNSAANRLAALINQIEAAGDLISAGMTAEGCDQLVDVLNRTDGVHPPPDFVGGDAATVLFLLVDNLIVQECSP